MGKSNPFYRVQPLQRAMAEKCVAEYCERHNLSMEKLRTQRFLMVADTMIFAQPAAIKPDGLRNDIETQPYPTLILKLNKAGQLHIEATKDAAKYLAK